MTSRIRSSVAVLGCFLPVAAALAQPTIISTNSAALARSGRLSITGTGFGADGTVLVADLPSWVSTWTDTRIVAYVPEGAPLGATSVVVDAGGQQSNAVPLEVTSRQADGRVRWIFEIDSEFIYYRPGLAPDGTLYVHGYTQEGGGEGRVFAVSADGALLWIQKEIYWAAYVPPIAGPDGAVYVGSTDGLTRISPAGEIDWNFDGSVGIAASAGIGPDGTVFTAFETGTTGAVALDPATGAVLWTNNENTMLCIGCSNELRLGPSAPGGPDDRFYVYWEGLWAFSLDGDFLWQGFADLDPHEPGIGSDGTLYAPHGDELVAYSALDGSFLWTANSPWNAYISDVEVGPDDTLYFVSDSTWVDAFDSRTQTSLWHHDVEQYLRRPSLSPDGSTLLTSGGGSCNTPSGECVISFIKAFDTTDGQELWHLDLDDVWDPDYRSIAWDHARVAADSRTAYFTGFILGNGDGNDERSLLWAIELGETAVFSDGFESGDTSAWSSTVP
ncbi:MAG: PQQ-binding-like beta-propeller repeat protein [Acidobacteriota bacterium]|nr:PQQ-binding-like beta-propeller repeat protein [Acidobacteriota bacterium]MDH3525142.1 PQQ-binding-like beta-propeller repeat protein [Acidobacteriota bacterium]